MCLVFLTCCDKQLYLQNTHTGTAHGFSTIKKKYIPTNKMSHKTHGVNKDEKDYPKGPSVSGNHQFLYDNQKMSTSSSTKCRASVKPAENKD